MLGHEITLGDMGVATQDEGIDANLLIGPQLGHDLIGITQLFGLGSPDPAVETALSGFGTGATGVVLDPGDYSALVKALQALNDGESLTVMDELVDLAFRPMVEAGFGGREKTT